MRAVACGTIRTVLAKANPATATTTMAAMSEVIQSTPVCDPRLEMIFGLRLTWGLSADGTRKRHDFSHRPGVPPLAGSAVERQRHAERRRQVGGRHHVSERALRDDRPVPHHHDVREPG